MGKHVWSRPGRPGLRSKGSRDKALGQVCSVGGGCLEQPWPLGLSRAGAPHPGLNSSAEEVEAGGEVTVHGAFWGKGLVTGKGTSPGGGRGT